MKIILPFSLILFSAALRAQSGELWVNGGASILLNRTIGSQAFLADRSTGSKALDGTASDVQLGDNYRVGIRFAFNSAGRIGHEIQYAFNRTNLHDHVGVILPQPDSAGMAVHQGGYNLLYYFPGTKEESKMRPFLTAGVHVNDFVLPASATLQGSSVKVGFNGGAGVKVKISTLFAMRVDIRQYETGKPNWGGVLLNQKGLLHQTEASVGFGFYF